METLDADQPPALLADGTPPLTPEALLALLQRLGIAATTVQHPPVATVEEAKALRSSLPGAQIKNLFLRDKREAMWLVACLEDRVLDLKALAASLGATGRLSFGSPERLMRHLGVRPGSVTPFAVANDRGGSVRLVLDQAILAAPLVNAHPLVNTMTTALAPEGLLRFLAAVAHRPLLLAFAPDGTTGGLVSLP
jgi:Ala-tRNA(Pro) deacylase